MSLSGNDASSFDLMGFEDDENSTSLTKSGHVLREEHLVLWAEANKSNIPLESCFLKMSALISSGIKDRPSFPFFSLIFEMGYHLSLPWKTIATALILLWRYTKVQVQKKNGITGPPSPRSHQPSPPPTHAPFPSPLTPIKEFDSFFESLSSKEIHILSYGCLLLASKCEETLFSVRVLDEKHSNYFVTRGQAGKVQPTVPWRMHEKDLPFDRDWLIRSVKDQEVALLSDLGFNLTIRHFGHLRLLQLMNALHIDPTLQEQAIGLANLCLFTPIVLINRPCLLAITILYLVIYCNSEAIVTIPSSLSPSPTLPKYWWSLFNASSGDIETLSQPILALLDNLHMKQFFLGEKDFSLCGKITFPPNESELSLLRAPPTHLQTATPQPGESSPTNFSVISSLVETEDPLIEQCFPSCRQISEFTQERKINEGAYGSVFVARDHRSGEIVAVKKMKKTMSRSGFPYYMLREILFLFRLNHPNIVDGKAVAIDNRRERGREAIFYIVMEFVPVDMLSLVKFQASIPREQRIRLSQVKSAMFQLLRALQNMHSQGLMHRDLKLANLLLDNDGSLKIADLGSIRDIGRTTLKLTTQIVTLWYRAPELLMGSSKYNHSIDMWSFGCLFVELLTLKPLFPGTSELETAVKIFKLLGRPSSKVLFFSFLFFYFILFYFILFYFILFYFILFYFILFYFILFYFILFYFILFYFILFYFILFYFILFYFILFYFILFYFFFLSFFLSFIQNFSLDLEKLLFLSPPCPPSPRIFFHFPPLYLLAKDRFFSFSCWPSFPEFCSLS